MPKNLTRAACAAAVLAWCLPAAMAQTQSKSRPAPAATHAAPQPATPEQMSASEQVHVGLTRCEFSQSVDITHNPRYPGYVDLKHQNRTYLMRPVVSSTGAMRLEDVRGETLYLQIANKSMLMNVKQGRRMVDECVHEKQRAAADALKATTVASQLN